MKLQRCLFTNPPVINRTIEQYFERFPLYLRDHSHHRPNNNLHIQPGVEISITHEGVAAFLVGEDIYMQNPGSLIVVPGNIPHLVASIPDTNYRRTVICFDNRSSDPSNLLLDSDNVIEFDFAHLTLEPEIYTEFRRLVRQMQEEMNLQQSGWKQMIFSQFIAIRVLLRRTIEKYQSRKSLTDSAVKTSMQTVEQICSYIENHLHDDLSLDRMSKQINISPEHLTRLFRKHKCLSYYQYVLLQRVMKSRELLRENPTMTLTEIAYSTGFPSSSQFSRMFKSVVRMTPSEYRTLAKNPKINENEM